MENPTPSRPALPARFRKWDLEQRRSAVLDVLRDADMDRGELAAALGTDGDLADLADVLVESAIGYFGLPLAVCRGVVVDGDSFDVPLVTEEPSVVAAATFAAGIVRRSGGFRTWGGDPVTTGQVFLENATTEAGQAVLDAEDTLVDALAPVLAGMKARGGGYRGMDVRWLPGTRLLRVQFNVDVRDAMGANIVNTAMETIRPMLERITGGRCLMAILTNEARQRITGAEFSVPVASLTRGGAAGDEMARRIALAGELAQEDASRAVTHNKGVMNGITALMLATGNDTRAV
jgi:hydroxymethylglutaryl-CoA reductase